MSKTREQRVRELAMREKAKKFIRNYYKENGQMPSALEVNEAKVLTQEETQKLSFELQVSGLARLCGKESIAVWDYVWDENSWNAAYNKENSPLKAYLDNNPDEDRWNERENRWAWGADKVNGEWPEWCVQCWKGAINAQGAQYPWCVVNIEPFSGTIRFNYDGGEDVYPWGESFRSFGRNYAIASIPVELGSQYLLENGVTTFDPSKLVVTLIEE